MGSLIRSFTKSTVVPPWICLVLFWFSFVIFPLMGFWSSLGCQAWISFCKENVKYNQKVVNPITIKPPWHHSKHLFWQGSFVNHWVSMLWLLFFSDLYRFFKHHEMWTTGWGSFQVIGDIFLTGWKWLEQMKRLKAWLQGMCHLVSS